MEFFVTRRLLVKTLLIFEAIKNELIALEPSRTYSLDPVSETEHATAQVTERVGLDSDFLKVQ